MGLDLSKQMVSQTAQNQPEKNIQEMASTVIDH